MIKDNTCVRVLLRGVSRQFDEEFVSGWKVEGETVAPLAGVLFGLG